MCGDYLRASEPCHSSRPETVEHSRDAGGRTEAARLRHRETSQRRRRIVHPDDSRLARHDAGICQPGAGQRRKDHDDERRLLVRRVALRTPHRSTTLSSQDTHTQRRLRAPLQNRNRNGPAPPSRNSRRKLSALRNSKSEIVARRPRQHRADGDAQGAGASLHVRRRNSPKTSADISTDCR